MSYQEADALAAAIELVGRSGGAPTPGVVLEFELGFLQEGVPSEQAGWFCQASRNGVRVIAEGQTSADSAADELSRKLIDGGRCRHCNQPINVTDEGEGCHWRREAAHWVWGCGLRGRLMQPLLN